jgi:hypothetical protein
LAAVLADARATEHSEYEVLGEPPGEDDQYDEYEEVYDDIPMS